RPVVAEGRAGPTGASAGRVPAIPYPVAGIRREVASAEAPSVPSASPASGPHLASPTFQEVARAVAAETMSDVRPVLALDRALAVRRSVSRSAAGTEVATPRASGAPRTADPHIGATRTGARTFAPATPRPLGMIQPPATAAPVGIGAPAMPVRTSRRASASPIADAYTGPAAAGVSGAAAEEPGGARSVGTLEPRLVAAQLRPS